MINANNLTTHLGAPDIASVEAYMSSSEYLATVTALDFEERCCALFDQMDSGDCMTLEDAAAALGLPWPVAGVLLIRHSPSLFPFVQKGMQ